MLTTCDMSSAAECSEESYFATRSNRKFNNRCDSLLNNATNSKITIHFKSTYLIHPKIPYPTQNDIENMYRFQVSLILDMVLPFKYKVCIPRIENY